MIRLCRFPLSLTAIFNPLFAAAADALDRRGAGFVGGSILTCGGSGCEFGVEPFEEFKVVASPSVVSAPLSSVTENSSASD